jgi:tRNA 2-selenouridine synthase
MTPDRPPLADLASFDAIIDVRSPAEFAEDHIPGAINCPVLDDEQRIVVGTLYKQVSPFEARKIGAALVSENIARHLRAHFLDKAKDWKPLIYCWRGGNRSGSMTTVFRAVGWKAVQLDGGYKTWRSHVVTQLENLPQAFAFRVVCGATGSGKTRILQTIADLGEQVLDLETLASHKGSVLGVLPGQPQPSQKSFETSLLTVMAGFDPARPVYVEAESRKIGRLHVPDALIERIRHGECLHVEATLDARVAFLLNDYDYFLTTPDFLLQRLDGIKNLHSREIFARWHELVRSADWPTLVRELLEQHYDALYRRSQNANFTGYRHPETFSTDNLSAGGIAELAARLVHSRTAQIA